MWRRPSSLNADCLQIKSVKSTKWPLPNRNRIKIIKKNLFVCFVAKLKFMASKDALLPGNLKHHHFAIEKTCVSVWPLALCARFAISALSLSSNTCEYGFACETVACTRRQVSGRAKLICIIRIQVPNIVCSRMANAVRFGGAG